jgi:hypothetical protein
MNPVHSRFVKCFPPNAQAFGTQSDTTLSGVSVPDLKPGPFGLQQPGIQAG